MLQSLQFLISMQLIPLLKGGCDLPELAMAEMGKSANWGWLTLPCLITRG